MSTIENLRKDDVIEVLRIASHEPERGTLNSGTFNIAGDGVLLLSQCSRRLGRPTVPLLLPAVTWAGSLVRTLGVSDFSPEQIRLLTHGRVVATNQMRETLGYQPKFTTAETFEDFARVRGPGLLPPEALARVADRIAGCQRNTVPDPVGDRGSPVTGEDRVLVAAGGEVAQ
jgi:UDP-glucose 4-epimerase